MTGNREYTQEGRQELLSKPQRPQVSINVSNTGRVIASKHIVIWEAVGEQMMRQRPLDPYTNPLPFLSKLAAVGLYYLQLKKTS